MKSLAAIRSEPRAPVTILPRSKQEDMTDERKAKRAAIMAKAKRHFAAMGYFERGEEMQAEAALVEFANSLEAFEVNAIEAGFDDWMDSPNLSEAGNPKRPSPFNIKQRIERLNRDVGPSEREIEASIAVVTKMAERGTLPSFISDKQIFQAIAAGAITVARVRECYRDLPTYTQDQVDEQRRFIEAINHPQLKAIGGTS